MTESKDKVQELLDMTCNKEDVKNCFDLSKMSNEVIAVLHEWVKHYDSYDRPDGTEDAIFCGFMCELVYEEYQERVDDVYCALEKAERENRSYGAAR